MKKSKLIRILKTFTKQELKEFDKFVSSPFFGCKKFVVRFFKEIKKYSPEFDIDDSEKKKIFLLLYPDKIYNDGLVRRMISDLIGMTEEFMMFNSFRETDAFRNVCFLHELRLRELDDIFDDKSVKILSEISKMNITNVSLMNRFFVENQRINVFLKVKDKRLQESLYSASDSLIGYFLSALNNKTQIIQMRRRSSKTENEPVLYDNFIKNFDYEKFIDSIENIESEEAFFIRSNYYLNLINIDTKDYKSYLKCKELFEMNEKHFDGISKLNYLLALSTFCAINVMDNNFDYLDDYFLIIEKILKENLFLCNSTTISPGVIRQVVLFSAMKKNDVYIKEFIKSYSKYFNPGQRADLINYCNAFKNFAANNVGKALEHLSLVNHLPPEFIKDIKILKIKIFYILNYSDSLMSEIDSLRHYLSSEKSFSQRNVLKGKNFLKFIQRLVKLKDNNSGNHLSMLRKEINIENDLSEKVWLSEYAGQFIK